MSQSDAASFPALFPSLGTPAAEGVVSQVQSLELTGDDDLLLLVQRGDREALGVLFDRYARLVLSVGLKIIRDSAEAEDLVHDVFLFLLDKGHLFDPAKGCARAWLAKVTYHRALDRRRYLVRRCFYRTNNDDSAPERITASDSEYPDFWYWHSYLQRALDDLSEDQRTTLKLHFFEGFTINEISQKLGISPINTRNYYYRGLERLRKTMNVSGAD